MSVNVHRIIQEPEAPSAVRGNGAAKAAEKTRPAPAAGEATQSVVSGNFQIVGDLTCHDVLLIEGSVEGNIECEMLTVGPSGRIKGEIRADTVLLSGTLIGAIEARVLTLSSTAKAEGNLAVAESLGVEPGATFDGTCRRGTVGEAAASPRPTKPAAKSNGGAKPPAPPAVTIAAE